MKTSSGAFTFLASAQLLIALLSPFPSVSFLFPLFLYVSLSVSPSVLLSTSCSLGGWLVRFDLTLQDWESRWWRVMWGSPLGWCELHKGKLQYQLSWYRTQSSITSPKVQGVSLVCWLNQWHQSQELCCGQAPSSLCFRSKGSQCNTLYIKPGMPRNPTPVIPALQRLRQEHHGSEANPGYIVSVRPTWVT
jgi:hypothetical protein